MPEQRTIRNGWLRDQRRQTKADRKIAADARRLHYLLQAGRIAQARAEGLMPEVQIGKRTIQ